MKIFNDNSLFSNIIFIIALVLAFNIPLAGPIIGLFMILKKAGVFKKRATKKNIGSASQRNTRFEKYKIMTDGRDSEYIEYLASAVGVSYESALRDLQQMVAEGQFGPNAYINYVDKTLVLTAKAGEAKASAGKRASSKNEKAPSNQQPYDAIRKVLLIAGIALVAIGALRLTEPVEWLIWLGIDSYTIQEMVPGTLMVAGGALSLAFRGILKKRSNRFKVYEAACSGRDYISIKELASKTGVSEKKARRDIEAMLDKELLGSTAYIDQGEGLLILNPQAKPQREEQKAPEPENDGEDRYKAILRQIRELNDAIADEVVSDKIDQMESLTAKIFQAVQDNPDKLPQIKSFMSYYLPTTLKMLGSYADFEASGADGENVRKAKAEIENILDTLVDGFKKQLDKLYASDVIDISSDIDVLETMLRRDGLTGDGSSFGRAAKKK